VEILEEEIKDKDDDINTGEGTRDTNQEVEG